ncbi:MAG: LysM peptidoglycan-binding domain-containing protein [Anaerolineae bacterium]|nr:LysM peptidoglycan-binding domain-containing protein [Anaerolineae bacterium]
MPEKKDWWFVVGSATGVILFIALTSALLMLPKPAPTPVAELATTEVLPPTVTPLSTMTPFPTATPFPTYTPLPTAAPETVFTTEMSGTTSFNAVGGTTYTVQPGDTVSDIADKFGVSVAALLVANDLDDETIFPGDVLNVPPPSEDDEEASVVIHTVRSGDTLSSIAADYGVTIDAIREANDLDTDFLQLDQKLIIPTN